MKIDEPVTALKNISLEINDREIFGLIGRNGAGKTTLTKIIATLIQPTSGEVTVKGFDSVKDEVKVRSLIGLATAEERSFYWRLSSRRNLMFFARLYGLNDKTANRKIDELFERLNLVDLADRRFSELSTGNKQKLAVARALLPNPPILLLDEPTRSLDPLAAADLRNLITNLENVSILLTSHNLAEIEELCSRVAIISKGEIRAIDSTTNLRNLNRTQQTVVILFKETNEQKVRNLMPEYLKDYSILPDKNLIKLKFNRNIEDSLLSDVVAHFNNKQLRIVDIETEKSTLLDVLESYE